VLIQHLILITTYSGGLFLLLCQPLKHASIPFIFFGGFTVLLGCACCAFAVEIKDSWACFCCLCVTFLVGLLLSAAATESSFAFCGYNFRSNGILIDGCNYDNRLISQLSWQSSPMPFVDWHAFLHWHMHQCCNSRRHVPLQIQVSRHLTLCVCVCVCMRVLVIFN